jgi:hypothetical protein
MKIPTDPMHHYSNYNPNDKGIRPSMISPPPYYADN